MDKTSTSYSMEKKMYIAIGRNSIPLGNDVNREINHRKDLIVIYPADDLLGYSNDDIKKIDDYVCEELVDSKVERSILSSDKDELLKELNKFYNIIVAHNDKLNGTYAYYEKYLKYNSIIFTKAFEFIKVTY